MSQWKVLLAGALGWAVPAFAAHDSLTVEILPEERVVAKSRVQQTEEQGFAVDVVELKEARNRNVSVQEMLDQQSGVIVRESGGLGSDADLSLNGMSGRHVRVFLDGVPIEMLGVGAGLGDLSANAVQSVEVYKGVVPVSLGADALGGAVVLRTQPRPQPFLDASWAVGSFGTHKATLNGLWRVDSLPLAIRSNAVFNHSDNNYKVQTQLIDSLSGQYAPAKDRERFHDAYTSWWWNVEAGLVGTRYADAWWAGGSLGQTHNEVQHALSQDRVFGEVERSALSRTVHMRYSKKGLLLPQLTWNAFTSLGMVRQNIVDTSSLKYDWTGNGVPRANPAIGEALWYKTLYRINDRTFVGDAGVRYDGPWNDWWELHWTATRFDSEGEDRYGDMPMPLAPPSTVWKNVGGLSYTHGFFADRLTASAFGKMYALSAELGTTTSYSKESSISRSSMMHYGEGATLAWKASRAWLLKTSWENAIRLPEVEELLGDGLLVRANPELQPEKSTNINLGAAWNRKQGMWRLRGEGNGFFRNIEDMIRSESAGVTSESVNQASVRVMGVEGGVGANYSRWWEGSINATWQDLRNHTRYEAGQPSIVYLDRLPNVPWLFGNAAMQAHWPEPLGWGGRLSAQWNMRFVEEYYLKWPSLGDPDQKHVIPQQWTHDLGIVVLTSDRHLTWSLSCDNVADARLYDNYRQQKPGRSWSTKLRLSL